MAPYRNAAPKGSAVLHFGTSIPARIGVSSVTEPKTSTGRREPSTHERITVTSLSHHHHCHGHHQSLSQSLSPVMVTVIVKITTTVSRCRCHHHCHSRHHHSVKVFITVTVAITVNHRHCNCQLLSLPMSVTTTHHCDSEVLEYDPAVESTCRDSVCARPTLAGPDSFTPSAVSSGAGPSAAADTPGTVTSCSVEVLPMCGRTVGSAPPACSVAGSTAGRAAGTGDHCGGAG